MEYLVNKSLLAHHFEAEYRDQKAERQTLSQFYLGSGILTSMDQTTIATFGTLIGSVATALATFALVYVTTVLAKETKKLAEATAQPQIVAVIIPNKWAIHYFDIEVENTGNAPAFDIELTFDPDFPQDQFSGDTRPLRKISLLKPGQKISSGMCEAKTILDERFHITCSWKRTPTTSKIESLTYSQDMKEYKQIMYLGEREPMTQVAKAIKDIRNDWRPIAQGQKRTSHEIFDHQDRIEKNIAFARRRGFIDRQLEPDWWTKTEARRRRFLASKPKPKRN